MRIERKFCDRCGCECDKLFEVRIPFEKGINGDFSLRPMEVCRECKELNTHILETLCEIRFSMYEKLFPKTNDLEVEK